jgi:sugar phosphate isomerase/epimerase
MHQLIENKTGVYRQGGRIEIFTALTIAMVMLFGASSRAAETASSPESQLGWEMAIHERTFMNYTVFQAMDKTAELGLHHMSFSGAVKWKRSNDIPVVKLTDQQIQELKDYGKAKGITFVNAYVQLPPNEAQCRKAFEFAKKIGVDILVGEPGPDALDTVEKLCKEYNIKVAIHDHPQPSHYWNPETVLEAIKGRGPLMGACADTGHWMRSGLDTVECLKKLEGHIFVLHFKDLNEKNKKGHDVPWGTGVGNAKGMMAELARQNFHGAFCAEYEYHYDSSMPELAECVKFFRETSKELAGK